MMGMKCLYKQIVTSNAYGFRVLKVLNKLVLGLWVTMVFIRTFLPDR